MSGRAAEQALIEEARKQITVLRAQANLPGMEWEGRQGRLNEAERLEKVTDALEAVLAREALTAPLIYALEADERHGNLTGRTEDAWDEYQQALDAGSGGQE